jgi:hypothetical protein
MKTIRQTIIENLQNIYNAEIIPKFEYNAVGDYVEVFTKDVLLKFNYENKTYYMWVGPKGKMIWSTSNFYKTAKPVSDNKLIIELKKEKN